MTIRGTSAVNSIPSSNRAPCARIPSSRGSLAPPFARSASGKENVKSKSGHAAARSSKLPTDMASLLPSDAFFLIAGPCVLEDDALNLRVADALAQLAERVPGGVIFKASFDKANRSNAGAHRGPGIDEGLAKLERVRTKTGLPLLTDVHLPDQCAPTAEVVDVLQIPAFLCRQTDLLVAAGATGKAVNVKKGQWMAPEAMRGAVTKVRQAQDSS